jgi:hypothetical protein
MSPKVSGCTWRTIEASAPIAGSSYPAAPLEATTEVFRRLIGNVAETASRYQFLEGKTVDSFVCRPLLNVHRILSILLIKKASQVQQPFDLYRTSTAHLKLLVRVHRFLP